MCLSSIDTHLWSPLTTPGPQRTSPTVPKNMPTPQRVQHNTPVMRKNPSLSRNGGSDAEIMELNQQVGRLVIRFCINRVKCPVTTVQTDCEMCQPSLCMSVIHTYWKQLIYCIKGPGDRQCWHVTGKARWYDKINDVWIRFNFALGMLAHCGFFFSPFKVDGIEVDCRRTREGERLLLQQATGHRADLPGTREWKQPHPQQDHRHTLRNRGILPLSATHTTISRFTTYAVNKPHSKSPEQKTQLNAQTTCLEVHKSQCGLPLRGCHSHNLGTCSFCQENK